MPQFDVINKFDLSIGGADRDTFESFEFQSSVNILEAIPSNKSTIQKAAGADAYMAQGTAVDVDYALAQYLFNNQAAEVALTITPKDAVPAATNPQWSGTVIIEWTSFRIANNNRFEISVTLHFVDLPTMALS